MNPSVVIKNHRRRGPMETIKENDFHLGIIKSIEDLKNKMLENEKMIKETKDAISDSGSESSARFQLEHELSNEVYKMKGGEI